MPYTAEISRENPTCFLFLVDQSSSMKDEVSAGDDTEKKSSGVADTINRWLQELSIKCAKVEGVRDYYHVGVVGYGNKVGPAFSGEIADRDLVPISEIADNPARLEERTKKVPDGTGGLVEQTVRIPVWFDPVAFGGTPMCRAASEAYRILEEWLKVHPDCFPPIVIHITDGEATDGNPLDRLRGLTTLSSSDGNVMLFNIHLSAHPQADSITFPDAVADLPDDYARLLFETASPLSPTMRALAKEHGIPTSESSRAFVLNADMVLLVQAVDIGTRPANLSAGGSRPVAEEVSPVAEEVTVVTEDSPEEDTVLTGDSAEEDTVLTGDSAEEDTVLTDDSAEEDKVLTDADLVPSPITFDD